MPKLSACKKLDLCKEVQPHCPLGTELMPHTQRATSCVSAYTVSSKNTLVYSQLKEGQELLYVKSTI